ncbi:MAG: hypothetical protein O2971_11745 [Proteobacteria bacterium]|nr:hypothetical protein [Pseudomonadota bacterium]
MDTVKFRTIEDPLETKLILDNIERYSGVRLPLQYIKSSRVVGAFLHNQLVASYMLITNPNFRSLMFLPDEVRRANAFFAKDQYEMMEVNGLWISPTLKTPALQIRVWMQLIRDIFLCRKKYVLLMRDVRNKSMDRFMGMANPLALYQGPPILMAGENTHKSIQVSYTTRWKIVLNFHKYIKELRNRQRRAESSAKLRTTLRGLRQSEAKYV